MTILGRIRPRERVVSHARDLPRWSMESSCRFCIRASKYRLVIRRENGRVTEQLTCPDHVGAELLDWAITGIEVEKL